MGLLRRLRAPVLREGGDPVAGAARLRHAAGTAGVKAFDVEAARTGLLDPEDAREAAFDPVVEAIHERATVFDLENYALAYAPPFNTAWDPVLVAAKVLAGGLR